MESMQASQIDMTTYEEPQQVMSEHQKIIQDLSDRLEEALRTVQMLKEEKESMMDQLEAAKTLSEVGNVYLSLNTKYEEFVPIFLHLVLVGLSSFRWV